MMGDWRSGKRHSYTLANEGAWSNWSCSRSAADSVAVPDFTLNQLHFAWTNRDDVERSVAPGATDTDVVASLPQLDGPSFRPGAFNDSDSLPVAQAAHLPDARCAHTRARWPDVSTSARATAASHDTNSMRKIVAKSVGRMPVHGRVRERYCN